MKKLYFFSFVILSTLSVIAQTDYYIDFYGYGAASTVDSVQVENFNQIGVAGKGLSTTIYGEDVLNITSSALGISDAVDGTSGLTIYPNPTDANSNIIVSPPSQGEAVISVSDNTGKQVAQLSSYLSSGSQGYTIKGLGAGLYLVNVKGSSYQLSGKLLSTGKATGTVSIDPSGDGLSSAKKLSAGSTKGVASDIPFGYEEGDTLKYTAYSGDYTTVYVHVPFGDESIFFNFVECTDVEGNKYKVVDVKGVMWMAENLAVTKFSNGDTLSLITNGNDGRTMNDCGIPDGQGYPDCGYYDTYAVVMNDSTTIPYYGMQYNFWTAADERNVCPSGWHVPSREEWQGLITSVGGEELSANVWRSTITLSTAGGVLKSRDTALYINGDTIRFWDSPNVAATDAYGFGAIAIGGTNDGATAEESFVEIGEACYFWTSTDGTANPLDDWDRQAIKISVNSGDIVDGTQGGRRTLAIRCIQDQ